MGENITRGKVNSLSKICSPERRVFAQFILYRHYFFFSFKYRFCRFRTCDNDNIKTACTQRIIEHR